MEPDPCHYTVSRQVTLSAADHHCPLASTKLYYFVAEAHGCEHKTKLKQLGVKVRLPNHYTSTPQNTTTQIL